MTPLDVVARPDLLPWVALAPAAWLAVRALDAARARRVARAVGPRVGVLAAERSLRRRAVRRGLFAAGLACALVAIAHPVAGAATGTADVRGVDLVVVLDVSRSMRARDVAPDRLGRAQQEVGALAARARGDRLALVVFAGEAVLAAPLTLDGAAVAELAALADPTDVGRGGTDLGAALDRALGALAGATGDHEAVVVLTDGGEVDARARAAAARCATRGIAVHVLGLGTERGGKIPVEGATGETFLRDPAGVEVVSRLDGAGLRALAAATGGTYAAGGATPDALVRLYDDAVAPLARKTLAVAVAKRRPNVYQAWGLVAFVLLLLDLGLSDRRRG